MPLIKSKGYNWLNDLDVQILTSLGLIGYAWYDSHVFYVNADTTKGKARPSHSGQHFEAPLLTVGDALENVETGRGDIILLQPSATNFTEGDVSIAKTDIVIAGMVPANRGRIIFKPTTDPTTAMFIGANTSNRITLKNIQFNGAGDGGNDVKAFAVAGLADYVDGFTIEGCRFVLCGTGISTSNAGSACDWLIRDNTFINCDNGILGYLHHGEIVGNKMLKTLTTALTVGISLLDATTVADSDGCLVHHNTILGGIEGTTPMADGIIVAAACYGVGVWDNKVAGCTTNITVTDNTAAAHAIFNITGDGREGGGEWANAETYLHAIA
jgi:hypothetical protein